MSRAFSADALGTMNPGAMPRFATANSSFGGLAVNCACAAKRVARLRQDYKTTRLQGYGEASPSASRQRRVRRERPRRRMLLAADLVTLHGLVLVFL